MSTIVSLDHVTYHHGSQRVWDSLSWEIRAGQKIGLVGPNGAGKSTLLRLIAGVLTPDAGTRVCRKDLRMGYLAQEPELDPEMTAWETVLSADARIHRVEGEMRALEARMARPEVYDDADVLARTLAAHARSQELFEKLDGYRYESCCRQALQTVGFTEADFDLPVKILSGGQRKMVGLAKLLATRCDLLLLDEPDNHLDVACFCQSKTDPFVSRKGTHLAVTMKTVSIEKGPI